MQTELARPQEISKEKRGILRALLKFNGNGSKSALTKNSKICCKFYIVDKNGLLSIPSVSKSLEIRQVEQNLLCMHTSWFAAFDFISSKESGLFAFY